MRKSLSNMPYLLCALLLFALTGCGANSLTSANNAQPGTVTAKIALAKQLGKQVGNISASTGSQTRLTVTGATIPTASQIFPGTTGGSISVYPGSDLIVRAEILDASNPPVVVLEGYFANVSVTAASNPTVNIEVAYPVVKAENVTCLACHAGTKDVTGQNLVANYKQSAHYYNTVDLTAGLTAKGITDATQAGCAGCHGGSHNAPNPSVSGRCYTCHSTTTGSLPVIHAGNSVQITTTNCTTCHQPHNTKQFFGGRCISCHSVGQDATAKGNYVDDNNGVRAITTEFSKWSHHVTGVTLNDAHCAACHLEGTVVDDGNGNVDVVIDATKHMTDNKTHLRNADTDADFAWDPSAPNHSGMDNFCMSCHDSNGATSPMSVQIQALINNSGIAAQGKTASPSNPFGDTLSNQYDKLQRPAVVDASSQFNTTNNSHHAVKGKKYSGRSRVSKGGTIADAAFTANSSAALPSARSTIYDAGRFTSAYTTLANDGGESGARNGGSTVGDDSTLHCGDCHTVGQFKANVAKNADGSPAAAAIGAHGSNNEYLLRNSIGTDQRHIGPQYTSASVVITTGQPYLICFNCHKFNTYYGVNSHANERGGANEDCNGSFNTRAEPNGAASNLVPPTVYTGIGTDRLMSIVTVANKADGTAAVAGGLYGAETTGHAHTMGNIYGIQCANCHNSGMDNGFGGIHGSKSQTYTDGLGNTTNHRRFLPGLDNVMFVPGTKGGYSSGSTATYAKYSSNKLSGAALAYTQLPVRNGLVFRKYSAVSATDRNKVGIAPTTAAYSGSPATAKLGSFTYTTGGVTNDLNWEQKIGGTDNGAISNSQGTTGCYTLTPGTPSVNNLKSAGYPADDVRYAPALNMTAVDGTPALGNWGGCEDHGGVAGATSEALIRGIVRPVSY